MPKTPKVTELGASVRHGYFWRGFLGSSVRMGSPVTWLATWPQVEKLRLNFSPAKRRSRVGWTRGGLSAKVLYQYNARHEKAISYLQKAISIRVARLF